MARASSASAARGRRHLIVVCCHGIWLGGGTGGRDEAEWLIAPFQRGETDTFTQHARAGVRLLADDGSDGSVLVFSGTPTRSETRISEAQSYAALAEHHGYWGLMDGARADAVVVLEERALDSYHNILFGLTRFYALEGAWPATLTLVGHAFKQPRLEAHCAAIGFPLSRVSFVGIDPPAMAGVASPGVARAVDDWAADPHGRGPVLAAKRRARNPWAVDQGLFPHGCRDKGGLLTRGHGADEMLVEDAPRPWS